MAGLCKLLERELQIGKEVPKLHRFENHFTAMGFGLAMNE